ncbi:MAG: bifunctional phosphopantothenoylcysteine decarboxylase/phosphopantothenate--cysteine ligase CoaBC [Sedimenticola sp.]|uniref:Coenzyme A biosynthesis bifunctional protein CoaBC n=1 Tax=Sedimenticola thiotaurini TaxID=1543721 RepID=A0A558DFZ1_9GAMM|nr:bifunctional phosphopantothenoylcysteine decarboxylase/phosphopantothenate--cysteine ligase CoaBC [Sedimenticola sp.]TVT59947.1 MAG: bifunctional phosphopantothenoylcysteine decarboxylase/phosphopantothenate--cysteine ligase CoaBC [Sedimenticola thiotaurini]MCW8946881.1 bifunctional phosphopantothenoylcysteine decarboxylase/phosphopantothenate--cysteine ligase CoaBC [Sedimenticola sp.]MCW8950170.1 bifunctional phosphopantothenoylcysteine decarboxylase/phosphopantothenate--cysteine ligase CoaB
MQTDTINGLSGRRILLGITGGIAAYKSAELIRQLIKSGAEVQVVMTSGASQFVTPMTLQALSGRPVRQELFDAAHEAAMGHIELARWADVVLVAPASASFMARLAHGFADNLLATLCLATAAPVVLAPAMNQQMWQNQATQQNVATLHQRGIQLWGPASGDQACGEVGPGRMVEPEMLSQQLAAHFSSGSLSGVRVLLTAGPTREPIDPVRFIGNRSSGKMGFALAKAFVALGASVELVAGPVILTTPSGVNRIDVETAREMEQAVLQRVAGCDIFVGCAAVADYRPDVVADQKIKKNNEQMEIHLVRNNDILAAVAALPDAPFTVGFAAETQSPEAYAEKKRIAKRVDMIAANLVGGAEGGFERDQNALTLIWEGGQIALPMADKESLAQQLVSLIAEQYENRHTA